MPEFKVILSCTESLRPALGYLCYQTPAAARRKDRKRKESKKEREKLLQGNVKNGIGTYDQRSELLPASPAL